jgi:hypothetical protein
MNHAVEKASGGMIYVSSFMTTDSGIPPSERLQCLYY